MELWNRLRDVFQSKIETGRCRKCCRSKYYCCERPLRDNEQTRFERISQMFCANKSPEQAIGILVEKDSWHRQAAQNCVGRWYGELSEGQGYAPIKSGKSKKKRGKRQLSKIDKLLKRFKPVELEKPWVILTTRYGDHKKSPTRGDLSGVLYELYDEEPGARPGAQQAPQPHARMRCGFSNGHMYVLDVYTTGKVTLTQWADQNYEKQLVPELATENVSKNQVKQLWDWLMNGYIDKVKTELTD